MGEGGRVDDEGRLVWCCTTMDICLIHGSVSCWAVYNINIIVHFVAVEKRGRGGRVRL